MSKIKDVVTDSLSQYKGRQVNLDSDVAIDELASKIEKDLKDAAKNDTEMYLELYT
tara:strand:+ start:523 stop:690 length:168 start_codon:yes stop_codon:yes gene_type:complete